MHSSSERALRIHERLTSHPHFEPLGSEPRERQHFSDHDLASLVESRFGERLSLTALDQASREAWLARATLDGEIDEPGSFGVRCYWQREGDRRIGTIGTWMSRHDDSVLTVSSLYLLPQHRAAGHAARALLAVRDAAFAEGVRSVRLEVSWYAQPALRFYLRLGMWVRHWKEDLAFAFDPRLPHHTVEIDGDRARFLVGAEAEPLLEAERRGDRLVWRELPSMYTSAWERVRLRAPSTFSAALASRGFPLLRSDELWQKQRATRAADAGGPEGLAFRIQRLEAWAKRHDWPVRTPTIPGVGELGPDEWDEDEE